MYELQFFDGVDIRQLNLQWIRSRLGLVSQEPILFDLTIAENITYGLENIPTSAVIDAAKKANIHDFIHDLPKVVQLDRRTWPVHINSSSRFYLCRVMKQKSE